jgi:hypothetical protein
MAYYLSVDPMLKFSGIYVMPQIFRAIPLHIQVFYFQPLHKAVFMFPHVSTTRCSHHQGANNIIKT